MLVFNIFQVRESKSIFTNKNAVVNSAEGTAVGYRWSQALLASVEAWQNLQNPKLSDPCTIYTSADDIEVPFFFVMNYFISVM